LTDDAAGRSYYGQPVLKEPVWTPEIPFYFFTGGLGGASAGLAYLAELGGNDELARRAWLAALAGVGVSPVLLISDLGKPRRFLNMLRMFKVTSPMSVGSWLLGASGMTIAIAAASRWTPLFPRAGAVARPFAAALGMPLSTYTAALITHTAIPIWHEARVRLAFVFASGAATSAGGVAVALTPPAHAAPARRLAVAGAIAELALIQEMEHHLEELGEPYHEGRSGRYARAGKALTAAGAAVIGGAARRSRPAAVAGGVLLAAGALAERFSIFRAGFQSAADPKYVVGPQRERIESGATRGATRRTPKLGAASADIGSPGTAG
jgi:hypothetical protein